MNQSVDTSVGAAICDAISAALSAGGIRDAVVIAGKNHSGEEDPGAFAVRSERGDVKLYLPGDLVQAYSDDPAARRKIDESVLGLVRLLRHR